MWEQLTRQFKFGPGDTRIGLGPGISGNARGPLKQPRSQCGMVNVGFLAVVSAYVRGRVKKAALEIGFRRWVRPSLRVCVVLAAARTRSQLTVQNWFWFWFGSWKRRQNSFELIGSWETWNILPDPDSSAFFPSLHQPWQGGDPRSG